MATLLLSDAASAKVAAINLEYANQKYHAAKQEMKLDLEQKLTEKAAAGASAP